MNLSFPLASTTRGSQMDVCKRFNILLMNLLSVHKLLGRRVFERGGIVPWPPFLSLPFSKKEQN